MENEQAPALESNDLAGLASFLADTPDEQESNEQDDEANTGDESTGEADTEEATSDEQDIDPEDPDGESEDEPTPVDRKIKVPERHEDGTVTEIEVTEKELVASYERQAAFTRKTQALAQREDEAVKFLTQKHEEIREQYLSQAEVARAAVAQMAGIKTESEMAQLANSDPAAWVAESQRQRQISAFLSQLDQQISGEKERANQEQAQRNQAQLGKQFEQAWAELSKDGIDKPKLAKIYGDVSKTYGFTSEELAAVYDHRMVRIMKDAAAYQALKAQKPEVMKKAQSAPRMPTRQQAPAQERIDKALDNKFKTGRAKLNDLAAFLR